MLGRTGVVAALVLIVLAPGCGQLTRIEDKVDEISVASHGLQENQKVIEGRLEEVHKALDAEGITDNEKRAELLSRFKNMERSMQQMQARMEEQDELLRRIQSRLDLLTRAGGVPTPLAAADSASGAAGGGEAGVAQAASSGGSEQTGELAQGAVEEGTSAAAAGVAGAAAAEEVAGGGSSLIGGGSPGAEVYDAAFRDFTRGSYTLAREGFQEFVTRYPESDLADNARYWIAESYYAQGNYREAVVEYERVLRNHPASDILAPALLKASNCHLELGETDRAVEGYRRLVKDWPESDESFIARQKLAEIGSAP